MHIRYNFGDVKAKFILARLLGGGPTKAKAKILLGSNVIQGKYDHYAAIRWSSADPEHHTATSDQNSAEAIVPCQDPRLDELTIVFRVYLANLVQELITVRAQGRTTWRSTVGELTIVFRVY